MERIIESEIMREDEDEAYSNLNLKKLHGWFSERLVKNYPGHLKKIVDIETGPATAPREIMQNSGNEEVRIIGVDDSDKMVKIAREKIKELKLDKNIQIIKERIPCMKLENNSFDVVVSKLTLHHFKDPFEFWKEIKRLVKKGGLIYIMDLSRPKTEAELKEILTEASKEKDRPKIMVDALEKSLLSAFTLNELKDQLKKVGLQLNIEVINKKYVLIYGFN